MIRTFAALVGATAILASTAVSGQVATAERPVVSGRNQHYVSNRDPLIHNPLIRLPIRAIEPRGWLRKQLELEAQGFTGHLGEISRFLRKEGNAWLEPEAGEHGWEEVPYWLKGYQNLAFLLRDEKMIEEAKLWIEAALRSQTPDGWFGPVSNRTRIDGKPDLWPNMIMLFCLQDYYDFTGDERVIELMTRYFKYLMTIPEAEFLPDFWDTMRGGDLLSSVYWLYNLRGESWLLELAHKVHRKTAPWYAWYDETLAWDKPKWHNVNFGQAFGQPATYWMQSQDPTHREAAYRNYDKMRELYGQFPGALYAGDENSRTGCDDPAPRHRDLRDHRVHAVRGTPHRDHRRRALGRPLRGRGVQHVARRAHGRHESPAVSDGGESRRVRCQEPCRRAFKTTVPCCT